MAKDRHWNCGDPQQHLVWAEATTDALRVLEGKWKIVIICQLFGAKEPLRFSELERRVEGVNQKMLIQQLKELEKDGIITRTVYPQVPPRVEYALTDLGKALGPAMAELIDWTYLRRETLDVSGSAKQSLSATS
ncbi:HxlR family transcriptional regulator [Rhizobium azibense]|uniref:HxlR family transcriptional regulator n=1 Tax=Rhizobium azibense TaxID=1136135 RepID=A0A4R3RHV5_9HYPH|nr:helix-turn-helix domain-containing protein [Rhizobium azibense]TCU20895.1 HxlR family transcriptional regulator [Rhizobium azibense]TCU35253.1 HxlR family transcriptional regulator [Rhizobium azibense]